MGRWWTADELGDKVAEIVLSRIGAGSMPVDDRPLLSPKQVADRLGVSPRTVHDMIARDRIASFKVEGARRIEPAEVDRYLAAQRQAA